MRNLIRPSKPVMVDNHPADAALSIRFWRSWEECEPFLLQLCRQWCKGSESDARELLSSAMLKAWDGMMKSPEEIGNFRAWLAKLLRNHWIDQVRRSTRHPQLKADPEALVPIVDAQRATGSPASEANFVKDEGYAHLLARMESLPPRLREVMMLRAYQNMSYKEIGRHLRITTENARKRVQLARTLLQAQDSMLPTLPAADGLAEREQAGVERVILEAGGETKGLAHFARQVEQSWMGRKVPVMVFHARRIQRLEQRAVTLRKYVALHPGGWKKELELLHLLWSLGLTQEAQGRLQLGLERQPGNPELLAWGLQMYWTLGARDAARQLVVGLGADWATRPQLAGYKAWVEGGCAHAALLWEQSEHCLLLAAQAHLRLGSVADALRLIVAQLARHPMDREATHWLMVAANGDGSEAEWAAVAQRRFPQDAWVNAWYYLSTWRNGKRPPMSWLDDLESMSDAGELVGMLRLLPEVAPKLSNVACLKDAEGMAPLPNPLLLWRQAYGR